MNLFRKWNSNMKQPKIALLFSAIFVIVKLIPEHTHATDTHLSNHHVARVAEGHDVGESILAATRWLENPVDSELTSLLTITKSDTTKFSTLQQLIDDGRCDQSDIEVLKSYEKDLNLSNHNAAADENSLDSIDTRLIEMFQKHATKCQYVYYNTYQARKKRMNKITLERVEILADALIDSDRFPVLRDIYYEPGNLFNRYVREFLPIHRYTSRHIFRDALITIVKNEHNFSERTRYILNERAVDGGTMDYENGLRYLAQTYLIEPCQQFVSELGPSVFTPARYDVRYNAEMDRTQTRFYLAWSYYMICYAIISHEEAVYRDIIEPADI